MTHPEGYSLSSSAIRRFVAQHQVVTESAKGPVPSVVGYIVGIEFRGSWWGLPGSSAIYNALQKLRDDDTLLVCKLVRGKVSYVDRASWVPLAALEKLLKPGSLARVVERHTASGAHVSTTLPICEWLCAEMREAAALLTPARALDRLEALAPGLAALLPLVSSHGLRLPSPSGR